MNAEKVKMFMALAGQDVADALRDGTPEQRKLGAQLLLSETLEYIIKGLGVVPVIHGNEVIEPENISYESKNAPDKIEMIDGLSDIAYTMYWNACCFGISLEEAFELVCDNNLEKFVEIESTFGKEGLLPNELWHCGKNISWPSEVTSVELIKIGQRHFAVGKDDRKKVRKPSSYKAVNLEGLL